MAMIKFLVRNARVVAAWAKPFVRKHRSAVTLLGALILFLTFIVNEGLREGVRHSIESAAQADTVIRESRDTTLVLQQLETLRPAIQAGTAAPSEALDRYQNGAIAISLQAQLMRDSLILDYMEEISEELHSVIAPFAADVESVRTVRVQFEGVRERYHRAWAEDHSLQDSAREVSSFNVTMFASEDALLHLLSMGKETLYHRLAIINIISYGLYALGWALALASKLYGGEGISAEG